MIGGVHRRLRTIHGAGLEQDASDVVGRRVGADVQALSDRPVTQPRG